MVFRIALAFAALAVIDDAFLHPEPGTTAADHLASGLVPVAVAAVLAWAYPRLGPVLRGFTAIACGLLALAAGIADGFRHVAVDRLAGDDITAMIGGVAGVVLVGLGAVTLWRERRLDERRVRRYVRRTLFGLLAGAAALLVLLPAVVAIITPHRAREPVQAVDLGRPYGQVAFTSSDGLRLAAWYVPSRNRAAVIVSPGRSGPVEHARMLARHG